MKKDWRSFLLTSYECHFDEPLTLILIVVFDAINSAGIRNNFSKSPFGENANITKKSHSHSCFFIENDQRIGKKSKGKDHRKPPKGDYVQKRKKQKKRKGFGAKLFDEAFDFIEDIFD